MVGVLTVVSDFPWDFRTVYKFITGASHRELNCFESQTTVGVLTLPFFSQDIRALESSKGHGKSLIVDASVKFLVAVMRFQSLELCGDFHRSSFKLQRFNPEGTRMITSLSIRLPRRTR